MELADAHTTRIYDLWALPRKRNNSPRAVQVNLRFCLMWAFAALECASVFVNSIIVQWY